MKYYNDYPTIPIGGKNPYYKCAFCGISVPQINGRIENHNENCEYRQLKEKDEENVFLRFLLSEIYHSLPTNRDWLNPDIEKEIKNTIHIDYS